MHKNNIHFTSWGAYKNNIKTSAKVWNIKKIIMLSVYKVDVVEKSGIFLFQRKYITNMKENLPCCKQVIFIYKRNNT